MIFPLIVKKKIRLASELSMPKLQSHSKKTPKVTQRKELTHKCIRVSFEDSKTQKWAFHDLHLKERINETIGGMINLSLQRDG